MNRHNSQNTFDTLKNKLTSAYKPYTDKSRMTVKSDNLKKAYQTVIYDLKHNSARTKEQTIQTAKALFELADCAVRYEVEQELSAPQFVQEEGQQVEEVDEVMCLEYG